MSATVDPFLCTLRDSLLLSAEQLQELANAASRHPLTADQLAALACERGWLTAFQIDALKQVGPASLFISRYVLVDRIGQGGMGQVYRARDRQLNRMVALKLIRAEVLTKGGADRRFLREVKAAAKLDHPHIVKALDAGFDGGRYFLAMEFVDGTDLDRVVRQSGPLAIAEACLFAYQTALALQHIHEHGLVHRDLKPSNLLRESARPVVKLLDLGLAGLQPGHGTDDRSGTLTHDGMVLGTPDYMAPEQIRDAHRVDIRADLYSLGCTLYFLLTGRAPFSGGSTVDKLMKHCHELPPSPQQFRPDLPPSLIALMGRLLKKNPDERPPTPYHLAAELAALGRPNEAVSSAAQTVAESPGGHPSSTDSWREVFGQMLPHEKAKLKPPTKGRDLAVFGWLAAAGVVLIVGILALVALRPKNDEVANEEPEPIVVDAQTEQLKQLRMRVLAPGFDPTLARREINEFRQTYRGEPIAAQAAGLLRLVSAPTERYPAAIMLGEVGRRQWGPATALAVSHNGKFFATTGWDCSVRLWNSATFQPQAVLTQHQTPVWDVDISADGKRVLAVSGFQTIDRDLGFERAIHVWDIATEQTCFRPIKPTPSDTIWMISGRFSPDGKQLLGGSYNRVLQWDIASGELIHQFENDDMNWVFGLAYSPDGQQFVTASQDRLVRVWDIESQKVVDTLKGHGEGLRCVRFAPNGQSLASCCGSSIRIWSWPEAKELKVIPVPKAWSLAWSADSKELAAGLLSGHVVWFDAQSGRELRRTQAHGEGLIGIGYVGSRLLSCGNDMVIREWDPAKAIEIHPVKANPQAARAVAFSEDGTQLIAARPRIGAQVWQVHPARLVTSQQITTNEPLDGRVVAGSGSLVGGFDSRRSVFRWEPSTKRPLRRLEPLSFAPQLLAWAPIDTGRWLVTGYGPSVNKQSTWIMAVLDASEGTLLYQRDGPGQPPRSLAVSANGQMAAVAHSSPKNLLKLWDLRSGNLLRTLEASSHPEYSDIRGLAFRNQGRFLYAVGPTRDAWRININIDNYRPEAIYRNHETRPTVVAVSADDRLIATATDLGEVSLWNESTGKRLWQTKLDGPVHALAFSDDGRLLATSNGDGTLSVFSIPQP